MRTTQSSARVWEEEITIPTYRAAVPEKNPLFIEKRAYQGSTGKVYPLPVTEKISDEREDVAYRAVYLENEYLKIMVLPELGGRIHRALDKTNHYDFVYYNHVIKPALVGLTGPWISGGIEFNWPQHHRPSTFSPVDWTLRENADGSCSVVVSEIDKMYGTKGMAAFTLYPGKAYIEISGQLYNRTDLPQTFLWWANPAVPVNDHTYSVFPPDVRAVMDHGKRAVSTFPIATGEYYKYDYSAGVDISRYANIEVPTSYMAAHSDYDFIGNYDEGVGAGLLHVADHHISPGKKQWTWGNSDFGRSWDRNLTDADGPYIELMTGVFTDNQPDFTWLKPYEEKTFTQYFMPYKGVGRVKNATRDAAVNLELAGTKGAVKLYATGVFESAVLTVCKGEKVLLEQQVSLSPNAAVTVEFNAPSAEPSDYAVRLADAKGRTLVSYLPQPETLEPTPDPADPLPAPRELKSTEELYLAAQHLEQYRHATYEPAHYYLEGLRRDPTDIRLNNGYGLLLYRRGCGEESIPFFQAAIAKQTWKNPNPYHGECYFNLGLALEATGDDAGAYDAFYKSTWSHETQSAGFYRLANLSCRRGEYGQALEFVGQALIRNWHHMKARALKAAILRKLDRERSALLAESLAIDPLDMGSLYEQAVATGEWELWRGKMRSYAHNYLELALDYCKCGLYGDALDILSRCPEPTAMVHYYQGYANGLAGNAHAATACYRLAETADSAYCFPNRVEEVAILNAAAGALKSAPRASYYLGCLYYDKKQYARAVELWEESAKGDALFPTVFRNLAIAYYNWEKDMPKAQRAMEKACALDPSDSRLLMECDQLLEKMGAAVKQRLDRLAAALELVRGRDALYLEYIALLNDTGRYGEALDRILAHRFHPWEGGEGRVSAQYRWALTELAVEQLEREKYADAIALLERTLTYPENLGEGKLPNVQDNIAHYYMGKAYAGMGAAEQSAHFYQLASVGLEEPDSVLYYNDQPSDTILYQGLANEALGRKDLARKAYHQLLAYGRKHLFDEVDYDYFAVSLPEIEVFPGDIGQRNRLYCKYLMALGHLGLREYGKAEALFREILAEQPSHQGAIRHMALLTKSL